MGIHNVAKQKDFFFPPCDEVRAVPSYVKCTIIVHIHRVLVSECKLRKFFKSKVLKMALLSASNCNYINIY